MFDNMHHVGIYFISPIGLCSLHGKFKRSTAHTHRKRRAHCFTQTFKIHIQRDGIEEGISNMDMSLIFTFLAFVLLSNIIRYCFDWSTYSDSAATGINKKIFVCKLLCFVCLCGSGIWKLRKKFELDLKYSPSSFVESLETYKRDDAST